MVPLIWVLDLIFPEKWYISGSLKWIDDLKDDFAMQSTEEILSIIFFLNL